MKITKVEIMATDVPFKGHQENVGEIALGKWQRCRFVVVKVHTAVSYTHLRAHETSV